MLALGVGASWLVLAVVAGSLWVLWQILNLTFDMLERWHRDR